MLQLLCHGVSHGMGGVVWLATQGTLSTIEAERNGESVDRSLMRNLLRMWTSLRLYHDTFENQFLEVAVAVACNRCAWPVCSHSCGWSLSCSKVRCTISRRQSSSCPVQQYVANTLPCCIGAVVIHADSHGVGACVCVQVPDYLLRVEKRFEEEVRKHSNAIQQPLLHSHGHVACSSPCGRATAWVPTLTTLPAGP